MSEEQKSQSQSKPERIVVCETKGSPPPEPLNAVPFLTNEPKAITKGLSPPPLEPVNISPFQAKPVPKVNANASSSESTK